MTVDHGSCLGRRTGWARAWDEPLATSTTAGASSFENDNPGRRDLGEGWHPATIVCQMVGGWSRSIWSISIVLVTIDDNGGQSGTGVDRKGGDGRQLSVGIRPRSLALVGGAESRMDA